MRHYSDIIQQMTIMTKKNNMKTNYKIFITERNYNKKVAGTNFYCIFKI